MSFIGNQPLYQAFVTDQFSGNGSTTAFTMSVAPANPASVLVTVSGVLQDPSTYSVSGNTLTFSQAPPLGSANISTRYLGIPASGVTTTAYRTITDFTATAGQTVFTPPSYTVGFLNVYQNGVRLGMADYVATNGTTVTLLVAASLNDLITTESFFVSSILNALPQTGGSILGSLGVSGLATFSGGLVAPGGISNTAIGATTLSVSGNTLLAQSTDQGTGVLQVTGQSTFNGAVTDKSLNLQGGNNLQIQSNTFSNAAWSAVATTQPSSTIIAPDGTSTASTLQTTNTSNYHDIYSTSNYGTSGTYTASVYVKSGTWNYVSITIGTGTSYAIATFNLASPTVATKTGSSTFTYVSSSITPASNGYYRISITATTTSSFGIEISLNASATPTYSVYGLDTWSAAGTENIQIWGAQLELGTVASNYTPTTTAAVTTTNNINVPSGQVLVADGSVSLPSYAFSSSPSTGIYKSGGSVWITSAGANVAYINGTGFGINTGYSLYFSSSGDTVLTRDSANTLAQRNSTNAQTFRLYGTYTDASNNEYLSVDSTTLSNQFSIASKANGTGTVRSLNLFASGINIFPSGTGSGAGRINLNGTNTSPNVDNSVSLGLTGQRWSNIYTYGLNTSSDASINGVTVGRGNNTATASNTALGTVALLSVSSGSDLTAVGNNCLPSNTTGSGSTGLGVYALNQNVSGSYNVGVGWFSLQKNTTAGNLTAIGTSALQSNTTNVATLGTITGGTGYTNGTYTGVVMTLSSGSSAITYPTATIVVAGGVVTTVTLTSNGVGFKDTTTVLTAPAASIGGTGSGFTVPVATLASGTNNVAVGYQAGYSNTTGTVNTFLGYQAGYTNTTGTNNTYNGYQTGYSNTTGIANSAFGQGALYAVTTNGYNSAFGQNTLNSATGNFNSGFGRAALYSQTSGNNNTAIGYQAGYAGSANANTTGSNNTYIGYNTVGSAATNTNEMVIGYQAVGLGTNTTVIGNSSTTATYLYGSIVQNAPIATSAAAPTIASSATIAPTAAITFISGTTTINTITAPSPLSAAGGQITLIPTGLWSTGTSGNIALATTAVVGKALILFYDATTTKWYPSY